MVWLGTGQFRWTIGSNGTIGTTRKCHSNGCTGEYASHLRDLDDFVMWCGWILGNPDGPLVPMVLLVPKKKKVQSISIAIISKFQRFFALM